VPFRTLFLNPPSFENFDGGAASRWPATREVDSHWYPVWLSYPAGMFEGARLLDAPSHSVSDEFDARVAALSRAAFANPQVALYSRSTKSAGPPEGEHGATNPVTVKKGKLGARVRMR
jgi:hypothetical protein